MTGFLFRCLLLAGALVGAVLVYRWLRPTRAHLLAAAIAASLAAFGDWWVEALLYEAGVWVHTGGRPGFTLNGVPMEMPLAFVPAGMMGLWLLSLGTKLGHANPAKTAALLYVGWCLAGSALDLINVSSGLALQSEQPLGQLLLLTILPFWFLLSATAPFFYWLALAVSAPERSILDVRGG